MQQDKKIRKADIIVLVILFLLVLLSIVLLAGRIATVKDSSAQISIDLMDGATMDTIHGDNGTDTEQGDDLLGGTDNNGTDNNDGDTTDTNGTVIYNAEFRISDDDQVWTQNTRVDVFSDKYVNNVGEATVISSKGDRVLAPGTSNSYTFNLENPGEVAMDCVVQFSTSFSGQDDAVPVYVRVTDYDGDVITDGEDGWVLAKDLVNITDTKVIAGKHLYKYKVEWEWPYENDNDELDTMLGNNQEDVNFAINIKTIASENTTTTGSGTSIPKTGDESSLAIYVLLSLCSGMGLAAAMVTLKKKAEYNG